MGSGMGGLLELPRDLAGTGARAVVRRVVRLLPPVRTPDLDADLAHVARLFQVAGHPNQPVQLLRLVYALDAWPWQAPLPDGVTASDDRLAVPADASGPARRVRVRSYTPAHHRDDVAGAGALVFVHGGGFSIGSLDTHDAVCRRLAAGAGIEVHSVEYRLAPEHPFPAGLSDIAAAWAVLHTRWVERGGDPARIGIGGDSAGGHAASTVASEALAPTLDISVPLPGFCWMVHPGLRSRDAPDLMPAVVPSGGLLHGPLVARFAQWHVPDRAQLDHPALNPGDRPDEVLAQHPPTWVQTVGVDPLLDEGRAYAQRLKSLGVEVTHDHDPTMAHGYLSMTGISAGAAAALGRGIAALRQLTSA